MRKKLSKIRYAIFSAILTTLFLSAPIQAAAAKWELVRSERPDAKTVEKDGDIEIKTAKGTIIISSPKPVSIKIFTILGQLVSQENLPAGISQLNLNSHGIFIVKTSELTCKVAI